MNRKMQILIVVLLAWSFMPVKLVTAQTWSQLVTAGTPPPAPGGPTNYDSNNNRLIAFVPRNSTLSSDEVWVLTNANGLGGTPTWMQLLPTGTAPTINWGATAVYDASANQLIVYGGCTVNCGSALSNVYVLSYANGLGGTPAWTQSAPNTAIPREQQMAVYDPTTDSEISFGGGLAFYGTDQNDTHVLSPANGSTPTWTTLAPSGGPPGVREGGSAVYDPLSNSMIVFGGSDLISTCCPYDASNYNDVWVLSNANGHGGIPTWTQLEPQGTPPSPRGDHSAVYDQARNIMYVFGGTTWSNATQSNTYRGDVWKLTNANGLGPRPPFSPESIGSSSIVVPPNPNRLGTGPPPTWTQIGQLGTPPGGNCWLGENMVFDAANQRIIVFGGNDQYGNGQNLTFILDLKEH